MPSPKNRKYYRDKVSKFIKTGVVNAALVYIGGIWTKAVGGPIGWIVERLLEYVWDKTGDKLIRFLVRKTYLGVDKASGKIRIRKINKAKNENNDTDYWNTISDI